MPAPSRHASSFAFRLALAVLGAWALPSQATVLYKSIGPNGVIQFSDTPPENGVVVEERIVDAPSDGGPVVVAPDGMPLLAFENPLEPTDDGLGMDEALAAANQQVDLAEHALALARGSHWTRHEGLRLHNARPTPTDAARIAFYERNLRAARANLLAAMKRGQTPFSLRRNAMPATQLAQSQPANALAPSPFRQ